MCVVCAAAAWAFLGTWCQTASTAPKETTKRIVFQHAPKDRKYAESVDCFKSWRNAWSQCKSLSNRLLIFYSKLQSMPVGAGSLYVQSVFASVFLLSGACWIIFYCKYTKFTHNQKFWRLALPASKTMLARLLAQSYNCWCVQNLLPLIGWFLKPILTCS